MVAAPAGIAQADWLAWPVGARQFILAQQAELQALGQDNEQLRSQLSVLASELAQLRKRTGRSQCMQLLQAALQRWARIRLRSSPSGYKPPQRRTGRAASAAATAGPSRRWT